MNEPTEGCELTGEPPVGWPSAEISTLYDEHSRAIYYLALRFLGDPQKAEDATHDVFLKAFQKLGQFRGEASVRTWLYRIPQALHRVKFRAIRRQGQQMNPRRQLRVASAGMKPRLIINDDMFGLRVTVRQLL